MDRSIPGQGLRAGGPEKDVRGVHRMMYTLRNQQAVVINLAHFDLVSWKLVSSVVCDGGEEAVTRQRCTGRPIDRDV